MIWNIAGFINIVSYDLKIVGQDLTFARSEWQKRYYARHASLLIFETINDLFYLLGKEFKEIYAKINLIGLDERLKNIRKLLNNFKINHSKKLNIIRNASTAHRDNNILKQFTVIEGISWKETMDLVMEYDTILNKLAAIINEIIQLGPEEFDK